MFTCSEIMFYFFLYEYYKNSKLLLLFFHIICFVQTPEYYGLRSETVFLGFFLLLKPRHLDVKRHPVALACFVTFPLPKKA